MKPALALFLTFLSLSPCFAAPAPSDENMVEAVAAEVNGVPILLQEVLSMVRVEVVSKKDHDLSPAEVQGIFGHALTNAIRTQLVLQEYSGSGFQLPEWIVEKQISETIDKDFSGDRMKLLSELAKRQSTYEEWRKEVEDGTVVMAMRQMYVDKNIHVSPADVRAYYQANEAEYTRPAGTHLSTLFLKPKEGESDEAFQERVKTVGARLEKEPFRELARYFSQDMFANKGGDWGWVDVDSLREELATTLRGMKTGETSGPVKTSAGVYFLRKEGERQEGLQPLEKVRDEIVSLLRRREGERLFQEWTQRLWEKAHVRVLHEKL